MRRVKKTYRIDPDGMAARAFANCVMILENAISMPDSYIEQHYGSDAGMLEVAEQYFDFGCKILNEMPHCRVESITETPVLHEDEEE